MNTKEEIWIESATGGFYLEELRAWKYLLDSSSNWSSTGTWGNPNELVVRLIGKADFSIIEPEVIESQFLQ